MAQPLLQADLDEKTIFVATVQANRTATADIGLAMIVIDFPVTTPEPPKALPDFEKTEYRGVISSDLLLTIEPIIVSTYSEDLAFALDGGTYI